MVDRVKSNSMEQVFHAVQTSPNINFKNYAPKDEYNLMGARELSDAVKAIIESNYNTGAYRVEYSNEEQETARNNINAASKCVEVYESFVNTHPITIDDVYTIKNVTGEYYPDRSGSGDASEANVRSFNNRRFLNLILWRGKNICGGQCFLERLQSYIPSAVVDTENKTVRFVSNASITSGSSFLVPYNAYKPNTQYTLILTGYNTNSSSGATNLRFNYSDGTNSLLTFSSTAASKQTQAFVTAANKTLVSITKNNNTSTTVLYYEECGLFEGNITVDKFEPFDGDWCINDLSGSSGFVAGGKFNYLDNEFLPYKYYPEYDGETLVGPWLSSKDEYVEGETPTVGAAVVDLGDFDEAIPITNIFPLNTNKFSLTIDTVADTTITYLSNINIVVEHLYNEIQSVLTDLQSVMGAITDLDARVTALENPNAQTTVINPGNSTLEIDQPEINSLDPAISTPDVEPTEPTENM